MRQTVVGVFDRYPAAQHAARILEDSGFDHDHVHVAAADTETTTAGTAPREDQGVLSSIRHFFADLFGTVDSEEVGTYTEAVRRGGAVVTVDVDEDAEIGKARDMLQQAGAVNIDEKVEEWRASGWNPEHISGPSAVLKSGARDAPDEGVFPVVKEELAVGKRNVGTGGVRVYSRVVEEPVEESVNLKTEPAEVKRRAYEDYDTEFRKDFDTRYATSGALYDQYQPAYRYGYEMAADNRYAGRKWEDVEANARHDWESAHPDSAWERFKASVRHAWERVTS